MGRTGVCSPHACTDRHLLCTFVVCGQIQGKKSSRDILYSVCSFAVCGIILLQIFSVFYGCGVWYQDKDDRAANRYFVLYVSDCQLLCGRVPRQGSTAEKSCHLCSVCDAVSTAGSRADCALQRDRADTHKGHRLLGVS